MEIRMKLNLSRKYQKGDYREYEIGLNHRIHYITGARRSEWPYYEEEWYIEHVWYLDRKREAELMCDSLLKEMFQARRVNQNIRQDIAEYKRGNRIKGDQKT